MKLLILADVSGDTRHVGDEAMLEANLALFRRLLPSCEVTVAAGPGWDGDRLGVNVVPRLEFPEQSESGRDAWLESLTAGSSDADHPAVVAARTCDALIVSGGGNLSSSWPQHVYERVAMARLASGKGAKVILLGQTLGPNLRLRERALLVELLRSSIWTGLRETFSYALALELGAERATLSYQLDDAAFLEPEHPPSDVVQHLALPEAQPWIAVTVHPIGDASVHHPVVARLASCLQSIAAATGADLVFVPHVSFANATGTPGDDAFGAVIARALYANPSMRIAPVLPAAQAVWLTRQAGLVISTRYHPLVFGLAAAIPAIGIWTDDYTRRKLQGALIHAGRSEDALDLDQALAGGLETKALSLWRSRVALREELQTRVIAWRVAESERTAKLGERLRSPACAT